MSQIPQPLPSLDTMAALCSEARSAAIEGADSVPELRKMRWRVDREPCLYAIDDQGERLNDGAWVPWKRRKSDVEDLLERYPGAHEIFVDSGVDFADCKADYEASNYEPQFWQATIWKRDAPVYSVADLEAMLRCRSGFTCFKDLFNTSPSYRPSCDVSDPEMRAIADHYDILAERRGDDRRAYRYGERPPAPEGNLGDESPATRSPAPAVEQGDGECAKCSAPTDPDYGHVGDCKATHVEPESEEEGMRP